MSGTNWLDVETSPDEDDKPGYRSEYARLAPLIGAKDLGASVYVLSEGQSVCPYHGEATDEEWLFVLEGRPEVRVPDATEELEPGDVVCFPKGPEGAHKVTNRHPEPARIAILSTKNEVGIAVYPDSNKVGVWPPGKLFRIDDEVDYWEGELS